MSEQGPNDQSAVESLAHSVEAMVAEASGLRHEVRAIDEKGQRDRRILWFQLLTTGLLVFLMMGLVVVAVGNQNNGATLRDCLVPDGGCAQIQAKRTSGVVSSITYLTEKERLTSEIAVAQGEGDTQAVAIREARMAEIDKELAAKQAELAALLSPNSSALKEDEGFRSHWWLDVLRVGSSVLALVALVGVSAILFTRRVSVRLRYLCLALVPLFALGIIQELQQVGKPFIWWRLPLITLGELFALYGLFAGERGDSRQESAGE